MHKVRTAGSDLSSVYKVHNLRRRPSNGQEKPATRSVVISVGFIRRPFASAVLSVSSDSLQARLACLGQHVLLELGAPAYPLREVSAS